MDLKNNHPTPLYHLIYIVLRDKILRGIYPKGSNIPSENELVKEYSVSRITARRSLENLSRDGLVSRHRGRGTIVTYDMPVTAAKSGGMEDLMENLLMIAQETKVKILDFSYIEADAKIKLFEICSKFKVDFFIHDSLHTPSHMLLEYAISRRFMSEDTIIASDDILWNDVFENFLDSQKLVGYAPLNNPNLGIFKNKFDNFERKNLT